jgi:CheY-like chemotaxis protein
MREDQEESKAAGMDGHISKPLIIEEIKNSLYATLIAGKEQDDWRQGS